MCPLLLAKFVTIRVRSDLALHTANRVAKSIASSNLVKTALYGKDANWGRILCAIGYTPHIIDDRATRSYAERHQSGALKDNRVVQVQLDRTSVSFIPSDGSKELKLLIRGEAQEVDEARAKEILEMEDLEILVRLEDDGNDEADPKPYSKRIKESVFWTCDFSHEYVTINGDYRT